MIAALDDHLRSRASVPDTSASVPAAADGWAEVR
jgi:hypothetical protein